MGRRGADVIVDYLVQQRVPYLVGVCGHGILGLLDAAYDRQADIKTISTHDERIAGFIADAYYRVSGRPIATYTSCGPGSVNLLMAIAGAMYDSSALLAITGNVPTSQFNRGPFQESGKYFQGDFPGVIRHYVKRSYQAVRPEMLPLMLSQAFALMTSGRPGPVNLDVPLDVFVEEVGEDITVPRWRPEAVAPPAPSAQALRQAAALLAGADRPVIVAGNGAMAPRARTLVRELAAALRIPVVTTPLGKGVLDENDDLCLGPTGRNGTYAANKAARTADVILALGTRFDDRASSSWIPGVTFSIPPTRLIHVDIDPQEIGRNYQPELAVIADTAEFAAGLLASIAHEPPPVRDENRDEVRAGWLRETLAWKRQWEADIAVRQADPAVPIRPDRLIAELQRVLPDDANVLADVGVHHNWLLQQLAVPPRGRLLQAWGFAAMGFGVGGVIGAKLASPGSPAVTVCGDGCFLMHANAVATAVEHDIPAVWVVWNNTGYGSIRGQQATFFGADREIATRFRHAATGELYSTDISAIARAMGADGARVDSPDEVADAIESAIKSERPAVLDVRVDSAVAAPSTGSWDLPPLAGPVPDYGW
jgi:acetolactate synthase I/II/III large subunit